MSDKKEEKEEFDEIFEVSKDGEEEQVVKHVSKDKEHSDKEEIKKNEKQLKIVLWIIGFVSLLVVFFIIFSSMAKTNYYEDTIKFETVKEGDLVFYRTDIPFMHQGETVPYNFYLRTHPSDLEKIPFEGELDLRRGYTLNLTEEFSCNGKGIISIANLADQYEVAGIAYIKDDAAGCDSESRYVYYEILEGEETKIVKREGLACYDVYVNNCEILEATEKIMAETFVYLNNQRG